MNDFEDRRRHLLAIFSDKTTQQPKRWHKMWPLLLAAIYVALIPLLAELEDVGGVAYLLSASAVGCLLFWYVRHRADSKELPAPGSSIPDATSEWQLRRQPGGGEPSHRWTVSLPAFLTLGVDALRGLPAVILWLPLPVALSWVAGMMARVPPPIAHYYTAFALWLSAIILFVAIFLVPLLIENRRKVPALLRSTPWREVGAVAFITAVAFAVRFVLLADEPGPFWIDEGAFASRGLEVARGIRSNFFNMGIGGWTSDLYHLTMGLPFKAFGANVLLARLPHAIIGTITVPLFYLMLREMFDRRVALVGGAILAVYHFHIHFSRTAFPNIYDTFFTALVLLFAFRAVRRQTFIDFALLGLAAGLLFYFAPGARLLPLVVVILMASTALRTRGAFVLRNFWGLAILLTGFVIASLPAALFWDGNPGALNNRWEAENIFDTGWLDLQRELTGRSTLHIVWDQFQQSLGILVVYKDVFQHYNAGIPLLTGVSSVFFVVGGVYALFHIFQTRFLALFALLLLTVIFLGTLLLPPVATQRYTGAALVGVTFVALGLVVSSDALAKVIPRWRPYIPLAVAAVVLLIAFVNLSFYFGTYLPSDNYGRGRGLALAEVADYLETFDDSYTVYFFNEDGFNGRNAGMLFRARDKIIVDVSPDGVMALTYAEAFRLATAEVAPALRASRPNALFLVPVARRTRAGDLRDSRSAELAQILELCPGGVKSEAFTTPGVEITYRWYEVPESKKCVDRLQGVVLHQTELERLATSR